CLPSQESSAIRQCTAGYSCYGPKSARARQQCDIIKATPGGMSDIPSRGEQRIALEHPQIMTVEEYFHLEEADTENRYEYIDGHVYMMAGGTFDHSTISGNIYSLLRDRLRGKPCRV